MIRLRTLGTLDLTASDGSALRAVLAQPRRVALLVYLAVATPRGFHRRDRLVALLWPEHDAERARSSLNRAIYFLRRELGDGVILSRGSEDLGLNLDRFWCDAAAFEAALGRGELAGALELYGGDLLPGFFPSNAEGFERWLDDARSQLRERASETAWLTVDESERRGELAVAVRQARRGVELAPFNEVGVRRLLSLLDRAGDRGGAVRAYQEFVERMVAELELTPAPETRALMEDIRAREHPVILPNGAAEPAGAAVMPDKQAGAPPAVPSATSRRPSRRRRWRALGVAASSVALALVLGVPALARARTAPQSVFFTPFVNRTGDRDLDHLGPVFADRIMQSVSSAGLLEGLGAPRRAARDGRPDELTLPAGGLHVAANARAGTVVTGEYHRDDGRIRIQAWIVDARRNRVAWAVRPVAVPVDSAGQGIDEVSRRVTGAVAALNMPHFASWFPVATSPPTIDAFQEFAEGVALQSHGFDQRAVSHLRRAVALDTTFTWAKLQLAYAYYNLFEQESADSIAGALGRQPERLNPLQRHWLAWMRSIGEEETSNGYRAMRAAAAIAPERFRYTLAKWALNLNRPREAIALLEQHDPHNPHAGGSGSYWTLLTQSYHAVGDGERELRAARAARRRGMEPMNAMALEISALAALGRPAAVRALLDSALSVRVEPGPSDLQVMVGIARKSSPAQLMIAAAQELRAHGQEDAAREALARAFAWYRAQPARDAGSEGRRFEIAHATYLARDWVAADSAFHVLAAGDTSNFIYLGFLGAIAARRHDEETARWVMARFDTLRPSLPQPRRVAGYWQGKISAILGDERRALTAITDVWGPQGLYGPHQDFDLERIWRSPGFREFIRPKG